MYIEYCDEGFYVDTSCRGVVNDEGNMEYPEMDLPEDVNDELKRLEDKITELEEENKQLVSEIERKTDRLNVPCGDALDKLWKDIMPPDYGDWEYAGQAYRHLLCVYREQNDKIKDLEKEIQGMDEDAAGIDI